MRRAGVRVLGLARQAASGGLQSEMNNCEVAVCGSRDSWLQLPVSRAAPVAGPASTSAGPAASASNAAPQHTHYLGSLRDMSSFSRAQHSGGKAAHRHASTAGAPAAASAREQHQERKCWQCGKLLTSQDLFFCPSCESVLPAPKDAPYFQVFDMDQPAFDLDISQLEQRYKALQRRLHPDKFAAAPPVEREHAEQQAAAVNAAYDVLKKPLRRAHYMLTQRGFGAPEDTTISDPELLMYVMEAREEVESAPHGDKARLQGLLETNRALEERCLQHLETAFAADDLQAAAELTTQLRYICRIQEAIMEKL